MDLSLQRAIEDSDSPHECCDEEMRNMWSAARDHLLRFFQETDQLRKQLDEKESYAKRRSKQLTKIVAQTGMEEENFRMREKENDGQNDSLHVARNGKRKPMNVSEFLFGT